MVRALQLQEFSDPPPDAPHLRAARRPGAGRERRRDRHRRRPGGGLQDRIAQPSVVHRALPGGGDRRRRYHPRHLHDGCAPHRPARLAPVRAAGRRADAPADRRRRRRNRRLRQQHRRADGRRRGRVRRELRRQPAGERLLPRCRAVRGCYPGPRGRCRQRGLLRRRKDGPRRDPWRHDGVGRVRRCLRREASQRAGGRSVHGEAAARGVPGGAAHGRAGRPSGHGRGGADLLVVRDGRARRRGHRHRRCARAAARIADDAVRDHAFRIAGADAVHRSPGPGIGSGPDLREVGPARGPDRRRHRGWPVAGARRR